APRAASPETAKGPDQQQKESTKRIAPQCDVLLGALLEILDSLLKLLKATFLGNTTSRNKAQDGDSCKKECKTRVHVQTSWLHPRTWQRRSRGRQEQLYTEEPSAAPVC